jgi:ABC-type transport system involved in multi-copper enzyme maturation permease subunit
MIRLLAAEILKLRTTWGFWIYLVLMLAITTLAVVGTMLSDEGTFDAENVGDLLETPVIVFLFPLLIGSVIFTNEFRHGTIGQTLLVTPRRERLLAAKLATAGLVGLLFGALSYGLVLAISIPWLAAKDADASLTDRVVGETALVVLVGFVLLAAFGAGVGGAVRSQVGSVIGLLVWFLLLEFLVAALLSVIDLDGVVRYLPVAASGAIVGGEDEDVLSQTGGALVMLGWVGIAAGVAAASLRRDVT